MKNTLSYKIDNELEELKKELDSYRPLPKETAISLEKHLMLLYNQESNAIEGNSLTLSETKVLLESGITAKGKPFKDHLDIINHQKAIEFLKDLIKEKTPLSKRDILDFHYLLLKGSENEKYAGIFRNVPVFITGSTHKTTPPYLLEKEIKDLLIWHNEVLKENLNPVIRSAILHTKFARIHPFIDGNGRTARLLLNTELLKVGYPMAIIKKEDRADYYEALENVGNNEDFSDIVAFIQKEVKETAKFILDVVNQTKHKEEIDKLNNDLKNIKDLSSDFNKIFEDDKEQTAKNNSNIRKNKQ